MPSFLILCLRSRDNIEPWPLVAFLLPPEEIVCQGASATITVGVSTPTVIVALAPWHTISSGGRRKAMSGQGSRLSLLLRQRISNDGTNLLPIKSAVSRELLSGT